jgi:F-type H+-transporting ATPase subunit gamma
MAQLRDIKNRIDSVTKTRKMTQAMKMVSASKFKRASKKVSESKQYLESLESIISSISSQNEGSLDSPLFEGNDASKTLIVLLSGDRGLCGSFNSNIIKFTEKTIEENPGDVELIIFGKKGYQHFNSRNASIKDYRERFFENVDVESVHTIISSIVKDYVDGNVGKVILLYNKFITAISNVPVKKQLLPMNVESSSDVNDDLILEPSVEDVLESVGTQYLDLTLFKACLESSAAEQGARMAAMDLATTNAGDMIKELTLLYNRQRQAQITTELSEIVSGAEALVS